MKRECTRCKVEGLTDDDFYKSRMRTICKECHRIWMRRYVMSPERLNDPNGKLYGQVTDLVKKACFRIREEALGLRITPLSESDIAIKNAISSKFQLGMLWSRYNVDWKITIPGLLDRIRQGISKKDLLEPNGFVPKYKNQTPIYEKPQLQRGQFRKI